MQKTQSQPTVNACTTLHMTAKQITVVSRAFETHRHVMQKKNETSAKLMTADIKKMLKLGLTSPNSVQSEIVQTLQFPKLTISVSSKTSKTSQNYESIPVEARQLSAQHFYAFFATDSRPCQSLALQPSSQVCQKSQSWQSMVHALLKQFSWLPIQTCTRGCRSRQIPKPS